MNSRQNGGLDDKLDMWQEKKSSVENAFRRMIQNANVKYIVISYNSEGLLSKGQLSSICMEFAVKNSFHCKDIAYRRYNNVGTTTSKVTEQLYFCEKI